MPSMLLLVLFMQLAIHLINTVAKDTISSVAWLVYSKLPTSTANDARRSVELRHEIVRLKREMSATSAQDNFSKWAKLRRQHDKSLADHDKVSKDLAAFKSSFDSTVNTIRWLATNGFRFVAQTYYQKVPMFWIPRGLIPYYAEWLLSFPKAPVGAISIQVWAGACQAIITLVGAALVAGWALMLQRSSGGFAAENEPIQMASGVGKAGGASEKKEL